MCRHILFLCTGNTCRSPMAEGICKKILKEKNMDGQISCESAGIMAPEGSSASSQAIEACAEIGVDLSAHTARQVSGDMLMKADAIYVMTPAHKDMVDRATMGHFAEKIQVVGDGVPDPYGQNLQAYRFCRDYLLKWISEKIAETEVK